MSARFRWVAKIRRERSGMSRLLPSRLYTQVTFPRWDDPARINWVDYAQINAATNPAGVVSVVAVATGEYALKVPAASVARTR